ncbi:putative nucleotidyltransferase [Pullulanibacillus pueri]|uniref:Polymerase nucleotidyl transferase domain-containing protein n=1 Tax=Pullulanibacillus pueri TaxID=1437324 RepID=A0A8J2ZYX6_9BACL|nr:nucleotidyltransferase domain-containing protein [Pullulanibacillus pueri]MBM7683373.1 putative nucleotidyltransferase [Pullulanibacillus pueri]GGH86566.1 hypothetical protein GCM10007096_34570 [Pullulanibacillus pueri]
MAQKSDELLTRAREFIKEEKRDITYAYVGGSVGRGEADEYSDIDLTVYRNIEVPPTKTDIIFKGEIIQLEQLHIIELPNKSRIEASPWDFRFLLEISIIKDEGGTLNAIKTWAIDYFYSEIGRNKMMEHVSMIVRERRRFALECVKQQHYYSATIAATGAWTEAGFLYLLYHYHSLANEHLIPRTQDLEVFHQFESVSPFKLDVNVSEVQQIMSHFRKHLREKGYAFNDLFELHDRLCERKIQRLLNKKEYLNILFQMYSEALWLFLETSEGRSFETYYDHLPRDLQKGLTKIGFVPLDDNKVKEICRLSEELLSLSI